MAVSTSYGLLGNRPLNGPILAPAARKGEVVSRRPGGRRSGQADGMLTARQGAWRFSGAHRTLLL